jgi:hypothetical protein
LTCKKDIYIVYLVYPCKDKFITLLYKLKPFTLTLGKVNQVKDKLVIKKEAKGKGKSKLVSKKAKVVKEKPRTP